MVDFLGAHVLGTIEIWVDVCTISLQWPTPLPARDRMGFPSRSSRRRAVLSRSGKSLDALL
jgi:hypothetical protein